MRTLFQNASHWLMSHAYSLLIVGLILALGSCTKNTIKPVPGITFDPVEEFVGFYELMHNQCPATKQPLEIQRYTRPNSNDNKTKMISISNLGLLSYNDLTAVWKNSSFVIEEKEVLDGTEISIISGELRLNNESDLSIFYQVRSGNRYKPCVAEYRKY